MSYSLDVVISFDTTGSMYPCLTQVRASIVTLLKNIFEAVPDARIGIIAHGDYGDSESLYSPPSYVTKEFPLLNLNHTDALIQFVNSVGRTNGYDSAECYELVLHKVRTEFAWEAEKRILIMFGDALPHEKNTSFGSTVGSHRASPSFKAEKVAYDWRLEAQEAVREGIAIYPVQCLRDKNSDKFYSALAAYSNTPHLRLEQFSDIVQYIVAIVYKQVNDEKLIEYGKQLEASTILTNSLADTLNLLLKNQQAFIGGLSATDTRRTSTEYLAAKKAEKGLVPVEPHRFQRFVVPTNCKISTFVEDNEFIYKAGRGFYQLIKSETVQANKEVVLVNPEGDMYTGEEARKLLGLGNTKQRVSTKNIPPGYEVFIQSNSYTRKLLAGQKFMYEI